MKNLTLIFSIFILLISRIKTASIYTPKKRETGIPTEDQYYLVFINHNPNSKSFQSLKKFNKEDVINSMVNDIHNLIVDNKNTYQNIEEFEKIGSNAALKNKFKILNKKKAVDSSYVYPISSLKNESLLYAYLSHEVAEQVQKMPNVKACQPNTYMKRASHREEILEETGWKNLSTSEEVYNHLSIISQGKFDDQIVSRYDTTYYYPSSAGKDIDIYIFDDYFNFSDQEYQNDSSRITECLLNVTNTMIYPLHSKRCVDLENFDNYHGALTADVAGGNLNGVANKANIYGVYVPYDMEKGFSTADQIAALDYINNNLLRPHKSIFSFSFGRYTIIDNYDEDALYLQNLINEMTEKGAIFVAASGNDGYVAYDEEIGSAYVPCVLDNVICVGAIDNKYGGQINLGTSNYRKAYFSNYGEGVDIYAPGYARLRYRDKEGLVSRQTVFGTSFSTPIVSGVVATIMSEFQEIEFSQQNMFEYLQRIGLKNVIEDIPLNDPSNLLVNNGKHVVYSANGKYYGCGINAGNQKCDQGQCCNSESQCEISKSGDGGYCKV